MQEHIRILKLASTNCLPNTIDSSSDISLSIVQELIDERYLKAVDTSSLVGTEYRDAQITLKGREYLMKTLASGEEQKESKQQKQSGIRLFISHSSADKELAFHLVTLIKGALKLESSKIRCTSVDGYRLPGGAKTTQKLRSEVCEAETFVAIISQNSLKSIFVGFELGARWGVDRPLIPLLAPGMTPDSLSAPLTELNALSISESTQLHQLIHDLAEVLKIEPAKPFEYNEHIQALINMKTNPDPIVDSNGQNIPNELSDEEQNTEQERSEQARKKLKKLCEVILHGYRSQKNKIQELGSGTFPSLSWVPNVLQKWEHRADEVNKLSTAINELPPVEFLKYSVKGDDSTIHTKFLLRDPYRDRRGDSRIGMRDVNALGFRLSEVPKDKSKMGKITIHEAEARSLDVHFERIMEQWIMFLDTESESKK